jgi:hypothetical protein
VNAFVNAFGARKAPFGAGWRLLVPVGAIWCLLGAKNLGVIWRQEKHVPFWCLFGAFLDAKTFGAKNAPF